MAETPHGAGLREHMLLFSRFLRSPRTVGALAPSSRTLARAMVAGIDFGRAGRIVELGPGTGVFTAEIVPRLGPGARLLAVDVDPEFVARVHARWPTLDCVCASAERLVALLAERGLLPVDHIVSGLPFVSLPAAVTRAILEQVSIALKPGGTFTTFQYLHGYQFPPAITFRRSLSNLLGGPPTSTLVVKNVPPAFVLTWTKTLD